MKDVVLTYTLQCRVYTIQFCREFRTNVWGKNARSVRKYDSTLQHISVHARAHTNEWEWQPVTGNNHSLTHKTRAFRLGIATETGTVMNTWAQLLKPRTRQPQSFYCHTDRRKEEGENVPTTHNSLTAHLHLVYREREKSAYIPWWLIVLCIM